MNDISEFIKQVVYLDYSTFNIFKDRLEIFIESNIKDELIKNKYLKELDNITIEQGIVDYSNYTGVNKAEILMNTIKEEKKAFNNGKDEIIRFLLKLKGFLESGLNKKNKSSNKIDSLNNIHPEIYSHIQNFFNTGHYATAVEEAYKITRQKLIELTGKEKAHEAFNEKNYEVIFGKIPQTEVEKNFCEGVKFLHLAIQNFRNEKAHTPAKELDKNIAIHYIYLASLALYLIDDNKRN